ncbi:MAG: hypothetical protein COB04_18125 [Gammaproteobacteria bacterium]|nr:MAG: hypothetical protein COB04_18125 [Gammaproteobacteria bacterium]
MGNDACIYVQLKRAGFRITFVSTYVHVCIRFELFDAQLSAVVFQLVDCLVTSCGGFRCRALLLVVLIGVLIAVLMTVSINVCLE